MIKGLLMSLATLLSVFCLVALPGAFVQAVIFVFVLFILFGILAAAGYLKVSVVNIFILSLALALSPFTEMNQIFRHQIISIICMATSLFGFGGVIFGIHRLQIKNA